MSGNQDQVKQFSQITGASEERAKFFMDAANNELQVALCNFYENENADVSDDENPPAEPSSIQFARAEKTKTKKAPKPQSNIATLHTLNSSSSEDEEEQGQAFYAGGSERSGQQVLGPPRKNPIKDYVSEIFRSAQQGNLETFDPSDESGGSSCSLYAGTGYRLGQTEDDHQEVAARGSRSGAGAQNLEIVTLTLWRQGFVINDGELRLYDDPANREFFESITRGEIPEELRSKGQTMFRVDLKDNRHEEYVKRGKPFKAFGGAGQTLGSPVPPMATTSGSSGSNTNIDSNADGKNNEENEKRAAEELALDGSQPTTALQIRLADGSRLSARFNQSHTVDQVRQYILTARPQYAAQNFALLTTFPSKELSDGMQTLKDAGLLNAAIMQRLK
ncbi:NSFL1 cofactor p47 [Anopheles ziemanni]|uniref:NSFL1 cofactor p47 n=1 Tax=Anopheles coustani TaxID=139045 RepID=UPI002659F2CC|nr:NSFL1 cofactor p47 [Anopheles coustani]XP_058170167.1 NSFL1 cofactor p47 [Anopheles ziemanni]